MVEAWCYWTLVVAWAIMFGLSVFWCRKYHQLKRLMGVKLPPEIEASSFPRKSDDENSGPKTTAMTDSVFEQVRLLYCNFPLRMPIEEDESEKNESRT